MPSKILDTLIDRFPELTSQISNIMNAFGIFKETYENDGILYICGNGGSAADAEHIVGELMKEFVLKRQVDTDFRKKLLEEFNDSGAFIADHLQRGLRAVALTSHSSLSTAFANDVESKLVFAQQFFVMARQNDSLLGISTSGNSENIVRCIQVAKTMGVKTVAMTGESGGECAKLADCCIKAPHRQTHLVQEYHMPIYHTLCLMLENHFYA